MRARVLVAVVFAVALMGCRRAPAPVADRLAPTTTPPPPHLPIEPVDRVVTAAEEDTAARSWVAEHGGRALDVGDVVAIGMTRDAIWTIPPLGEIVVTADSIWSISGAHLERHDPRSGARITTVALSSSVARVGGSAAVDPAST